MSHLYVASEASSDALSDMCNDELGFSGTMQGGRGKIGHRGASKGCPIIYILFKVPAQAFAV